MDKYGIYVYWAFGLTIFSLMSISIYAWFEYNRTKKRWVLLFKQSNSES